LRFDALESPTAIMAIGIAASNTCPILRPKYAAAAEKSTAIISPKPTERAFTSEYSLSGDNNGLYSSPSRNSRDAFSGKPVIFSSSCINKFIKFLFFEY
jgi:hypothetical protein